MTITIPTTLIGSIALVAFCIYVNLMIISLVCRMLNIALFAVTKNAFNDYMRKTYKRQNMKFSPKAILRTMINPIPSITYTFGLFFRKSYRTEVHDCAVRSLNRRQIMLDRM